MLKENVKKRIHFKLVLHRKQWIGHKEKMVVWMFKQSDYLKAFNMLIFANTTS